MEVEPNQNFAVPGRNSIQGASGNLAMLFLHREILGVLPRVRHTQSRIEINPLLAADAARKARDLGLPNVEFVGVDARRADYRDGTVFFFFTPFRGSVREAVLEGGGELLASAEVFDLYHGEQVGEGRKSLALRLTFRATDRTLTDEEVAERRSAITKALEAIGGQLRA